MTKLSRLQQSQLSVKPIFFNTIIATFSLWLAVKGLVTNSTQLTLIHYRNHLCPSLTPSSTRILIYLMSVLCIDYYNSSFGSRFLIILPPKSPEPAPLVIWLLFQFHTEFTSKAVYNLVSPTLSELNCIDMPPHIPRSFSSFKYATMFRYASLNCIVYCIWKWCSEIIIDCQRKPGRDGKQARTSVTLEDYLGESIEQE